MDAPAPAPAAGVRGASAPVRRRRQERRLQMLALAALLAGAAGCSASRVVVVDAVSGKPVADAEVAVVDRQAAVLVSRRTGGSGEVGLPAAPAADALTVSASGYRTWGAAWGAAPPARLQVALEPAYIGAFLGSGAAGMDAPTAQFVKPRHHCPCEDAR
jgi:hypothetical protein